MGYEIGMGTVWYGRHSKVKNGIPCILHVQEYNGHLLGNQLVSVAGLMLGRMISTCVPRYGLELDRSQFAHIF